MVGECGFGENRNPEYGFRALRDLLDVRDRALSCKKIRNNGVDQNLTVNHAAGLAAEFGYNPAKAS